MEIDGKKIGEGYPVYVIAEAGVNHNANLENALKMIDVAFECGADAIKFQTFKTSSLIIRDVDKAPYQRKTTSELENQAEMLQKLEIDELFHHEIVKYCKYKGITFLSTPYDEISLNLLIKLQIPAIKIASTDTTNLLLLEKVGKAGLPVILSTGMCNMKEIERSYYTLKKNGCSELALLKCTSNYPTSLTEVNFKGLLTLAGKFNEITGFSDHTSGIGASPYAVAYGAKIIEKHFTLDKSMDGPDHRASLTPIELKSLIEEIRKVETMGGSSVIEPTESEITNKCFLQKCFVASKNINKGSKLSRANLIAKRTGGEGIPAGELYNILGRLVGGNIQKGKIINFGDLLE